MLASLGLKTIAIRKCGLAAGRVGENRAKSPSPLPRSVRNVATPFNPSIATTLLAAAQLPEHPSRFGVTFWLQSRFLASRSGISTCTRHLSSPL